MCIYNIVPVVYKNRPGGRGGVGQRGSRSGRAGFLAASFRHASGFKKNVLERIMTERVSERERKRGRGGYRSRLGENTVYRRTWSHMRPDLSYESGRRGRPHSALLYRPLRFVNNVPRGIDVCASCRTHPRDSPKGRAPSSPRRRAPYACCFFSYLDSLWLQMIV